MIGGLYNTTSLLIEPTRALGDYLRATDGSAAPLSAQQAGRGLTGPAEGTEAGAVPDRLPTGVVNFIPVVIRIMEAKAAEAVPVDTAETIETEPAPRARDDAAQASPPDTDAAREKDAVQQIETIGQYMKTAAAPESAAPLDTVI